MPRSVFQVTRAELAALLADRLNLTEVIGTGIYTDTGSSPQDLAIRQNTTAEIMKGIDGSNQVCGNAG